MDPKTKWLTPWFLSAPGLMVFCIMLIFPLGLTAVLSFRVFDGMYGVQETFTFANYLEVVLDPYYHEIFLRTGLMSLGVTGLCILIGVPETLILSRMKSSWKSFFLVIILAPLLISVVVRTLGWSILLGTNGIINDTLVFFGIVDEPITLIFTMTGLIIALTHVMVPFMVISVWASLQKLDPQIENAGLSLGAKPFVVIRRIIFPQILPGVLSGSIIVFAMTASAFATPALLGGRRLKVVATAAYDEFLSTLNWPLGAAIAVVLLIVNIIIIFGSNQLIERKYKQIFRS